MRKVYLQLLSFVVASVCCLLVALVLSRPATSEVVTKGDDSASSVIANYKKWMVVNFEPKFVPAIDAASCGPAFRFSLDKDNPHRDKFVVVYVNDLGRAAMMEQLKPVFPKGSVIVKEKRVAKDSSAPELLTVMRKREPGYDPERGDGEYFVFDGSGKTIQESGKLEKCQACHLFKKGTDYLFRDYMPSDNWDRMK